MMFRPAVLALLLLLAGCANKMLLPDEISAASLTPSTGLLIGSFARNPDGRSYQLQEFYFKNVETQEKHLIKAQPHFNPLTGKTPDDFSTDQSKGAVFAQQLPAGKYVFYNFRLFQSSGMFSENWYSKTDFAIPFEVHANTANYVGEIRLDPVTGKNLFGMHVQAGGVWVISDQRSRDVELLGRLRPGIPLQEVASVVPDRKDVFTPLVVLPSELATYQRPED